MKEKLKIWFSDFTEDINPENNYLTNLLKPKYNLIFDKHNPEYLIFSSYGYNFLKFQNSIRIYYTGENLVPDFNLCDYAIGFHNLDIQDRYIRFPYFAILRDQFISLLEPRQYTEEILKTKPYFCNYIYANSQANPSRENFFYLLSKYKKVSSPGKHLNNCQIDIGKRYDKDWMYTKLDFQSKCKFTIAFENSFCPGYTTEKILHAFISKSIPIYWGNPEVVKDFNPEAFINCHDYKSPEQIVNKIKELEENNQLYLKMLNQPPLKQNTIPDHLEEKKLLSFFDHIFKQERHTAYRRPQYGYVAHYENKLFNLNFKKSKLQKLKYHLKKRLS